MPSAPPCGLRVADVDFMGGVINPAVQYPAEDLKTDMSKTPIPVAQSMALELAEHVRTNRGRRYSRRTGAPSSARGRLSARSGQLASR
jgi:hypothetical protein